MTLLILAEVSAAKVIGGAERVLREQALWLAQRGHQVSLVVRAPLEDARAQVAVGPVTEHRYGVVRGNQGAFVLSSFFRSVRAFDLARSQAVLDIVLVHQSMAGLGPILMRRASASGWVYVCHSLAHEEYLSRSSEPSALLSRVSRSWGAKLRRWCERLVMRRCARVIVLSEFMKERVMTLHDIEESRIRIVPGGADPAIFRPAGDRTEVRRRLGIPADRLVLLAVRNLVARMGLDRLIQAMVTVGQAHPEILLLVGGSGPLRQELEQLIADLHLTDRVKLLGFIAEEELPDHYQAADLVLMPTHELEGFGLVTVEALACGTPVLGTPVGAIPEVLARLDKELLAAGSDPDSLALAITRILSRFREQPGEWDRLSLKGRTLVTEDYNWSKHTEQLDALLQEACGRASRSSRAGVMVPRRVMHVITRLDRGGSAQNTMITALGQDRTRFEPLVVAGHAGQWDDQGGDQATDQSRQRLESSGVRCLLIPTLTREVHPFKDLATLWTLITILRREKPALVHTHTSKAGVLGRLAAWMAGVPVVVHTPHGHIFYGHFGPVASWIFLQVERLLARGTAHLIALTESERDEHLAEGVGQADRFSVVPSGIDLERFRCMVGRFGRRPAGMNCPSDAIVVGSVGWLTEVKGHKFLIEALARLKPQHPRLHVVILGSGRLREPYLALAEQLGVGNAVHLLGERQDVPDCLAAMDLFVLPSLNEGMGRALVEAMAAGRPVIASNVGGIPAIVEDQRTGLLVPPGDVVALAEAIEELLAQPDRAKAMGVAASHSIGAKFGAQSMVQAVEAVYETALAKGGIS